MWQIKQETLTKSSSSSSSFYRDSIKALEADIQHANTLAASLPQDNGGDHIQMKLSYSPFAPFFFYLLEWMDFSCTDSLPSSLGLFHILIDKVYVDGMPSLSSKERIATLKDFYAVIYPSLILLEGELNASKSNNCTEIVDRKRAENNKEQERDDECGICMETSMNMVLPTCAHSLCITCFHDWYMRSESCPFCRGSLKKTSPTDLWVVIGNNDVIDNVTLARDNLRRFYLYMDTLPLILQDTRVFVFNYML